MADQTITLSYKERSALLTILGLARPEVSSEFPEYLDILYTIMTRVSRLECQPGGCEYCNADAAREASEQRDYADHLAREEIERRKYVDHIIEE